MIMILKCILIAANVKQHKTKKLISEKDSLHPCIQGCSLSNVVSSIQLTPLKQTRLSRGRNSMCVPNMVNGHLANRL